MKAILAISVIPLSQLCIASGSGRATVALLTGIPGKPLSNAQKKGDCVTSVKRGSTGVKDREYLPVYWTPAVSRGSCWTVDPYSPYGLHWSSNTGNKMNDFIVYQYDVRASKQVTLELKGGRISFSNKSGKGSNALYLWVYSGNPPDSLLKGKELDSKKETPTDAPTTFPKKWFKPDYANYVKIDPLNITINVRAGTLSVVLAGVDSSPDTSVRIDIVGLRLVSKMPQPKQQMMKP